VKIVSRIAALALLLAVTAVVSPQTGAAATQAVSAQAAAAIPELDGDYYTGFEDGLKPWVGAATRPGAVSLARVTGENGCYDLIGNAYANLKGSSATEEAASVGSAGAIPLPVGTWIGTGYPAAGLNTVRVAWNSRNTGDCEGCIPMVYVGTTTPRFTTQFTQMEAPLSTKWQSYEFNKVIGVAEGEAVYVAIGWSGTEASIGLDCINVQISSMLDQSASDK
jgi:hypothetical protein